MASELAAPVGSRFDTLDEQREDLREQRRIIKQKMKGLWEQHSAYGMELAAVERKLGIDKNRAGG